MALSLAPRLDVIVAFGTFIRENGPNDVIDGEKCPKNSVCVVIDQAIDGKAELPIPMYECELIGDAVGSQVAWPKHLVKLRVRFIFCITILVNKVCILYAKMRCIAIFRDVEKRR